MYCTCMYNVGGLLEQRISKARYCDTRSFGCGSERRAASCGLSILQIHAIIYIDWKISWVRRRLFAPLRKGDIALQGKKRFSTLFLSKFVWQIFHLRFPGAGIAYLTSTTLSFLSQVRFELGNYSRGVSSRMIGSSH